MFFDNFFDVLHVMLVKLEYLLASIQCKALAALEDAFKGPRIELFFPKLCTLAALQVDHHQVSAAMQVNHLGPLDLQKTKVPVSMPPDLQLNPKKLPGRNPPRRSTMQRALQEPDFELGPAN